MATPDEVLQTLGQAMEDGVPSLTTALTREADESDNTVEWPHGDITVVSNLRADQWNTDVVGPATDSEGNHVGYIIDAKFDAEMQLNIWAAAPSDEWDIKVLGGTLSQYLRRFDANRRDPETLPEPAGDDIKKFRITDDGDLPVENGQPPIRGYSVSVEFRFTDRIDTSEEYGQSDYVESVQTPTTEDLASGEDAAIEYKL